MQFVANGPDIPDELLQAHEEGRVVFFCGAGISYPAGLPGFKGLVEKIYKKAGTTQSAIEKEAFDRSQFDATLDLLERRLPGQRLAVRQALAKVLKPKLKLQGATETHEALLRLAHSREGALRLVTTNFDRIFDTAAKRMGQAFQAYSAPMLPIPKNSRWNGLVYLHGLLPRKVDDTALNRLVITSGDFGLAYLTERWAARFVSELFRNYVVCFIGYSINDPVLRYMMDALAADRMLGETTPQAWALGDCEAGQERSKTIEWEAKGVKPILYEVPAGTYDHSALHRTLHAWGETYRDSVLGKERIVVSHAIARPSASTRQDDFVGRLLWALSDKSGLPARRFAEFNPAPSLDWLFDALSQNRYRHGDLSRFGVPPGTEVDAQLSFSLIHRPTPYSLAPRMMLLSSAISAPQWDAVMYQLARWLVRHLNDPRLIIWIVEQGGSLHYSWHRLIKDQLNTTARLEQEGKASELAELCGDAPNALPGPHMRTLWRLLLSGLVRSHWRDSSLYSWKECFKRDGLTVALRFELRELLSPKILLKKPFRWGEESQTTDESTRIRHLVDWELVLASDSISSALRDLKGNDWESALPSLLEDLQKLLRDALDLISELGEADDLHDRSYWDLPSISPHWQNRGFRDWVALIELVRDAWLAVHNTNPPRAALIAQTWFELPYPTFKRLAFFAARHDHCVAPNLWVDWLLSDDAWWLWASDTKREVLRLIVLQGSTLALPDQARLEAAILNGPPRHMFRDDLEPDRWQGLVEREVWLHLAKLNISGLALSTDATARLHELSRTNPLWELAANESDEFSHWMSGTGDPDYEDNRKVDIAPHKRSDLVPWLKQPATDDYPFHEDTWSEVCRKHLLNSLFALSDLAQEDIWPAGRWRTALQVWSDKGRLIRSWHYAAPLIQSMPDAVLLDIAHSVTHWLQEVSKAIDLSHEALVLSLSRRVMSLPLDAGSGMTRNGAPLDEPVTEAINHPIGHIAQVLLNMWLRRKPNDNDLLPAEIRPLFTQLCNVQVDRYRHARVLLGSRLIVLFRVDRAWTEQYLLPLLNWKLDAAEAKAAWEGFLWSPRLYRPLLIAFKLHFLETAHRYSDLGEHAQQFATFLTYAALGPTDGYTIEEFRDAIAALPQEGLQESAQALSQALEGAADQREEYWRNRIRPFWQHIWPKSLDLATSRIAESLARLSIAAGAEFPAALRAVQDWLRPLEHPHYVLHRLHESGLCSQFPAEALRLMGIIVDNQPWVSSEVEQCLNAIEQAGPALAQDAQYRRLREYSRQRGG